MRESQQIAGLFSFVAAIPWMVNGFLFVNPNMLVARVLSYIPLTAPMMMMLRLAIGQPPIEDIVGSIVVLIISVPIFLWAAQKFSIRLVDVWQAAVDERDLESVAECVSNEQ